MESGKTLTEGEISSIQVLRAENYSIREIAKRIRRSHGVVHNYLKNPENYGKNRKGGVKTTTPRERHAILRVASNSTMSARSIGAKVGTLASVRSVQRIIKEAPHIQLLKMKRKPALKTHHQEARLQFAKNHMSWTSEWQQVVFSNEKRFCLDGSDGYSYYFHDLRKEQLYMKRRQQAAGSVMIWGAISYFGPIDVVVIEGKQNSLKYIQLLADEKLKITEVLESRRWIFQQDNASIHTARQVKEWFSSENIEVLDWPALSPDLNIIENLWGWLTRRIYENGKQYEDIFINSCNKSCLE